jgi:hypothetical protein
VFSVKDEGGHLYPKHQEDIRMGKPEKTETEDTRSDKGGNR